MPRPPVTQDLEDAFLRQYDAAPPQAVNCLTAPPQEMEAAIRPMIEACVRAGLPDLTPAQRAAMAGQLTPEHRELALAVCDLLERREDIAAEVRFGTPLIQEILDRDIESESFGAAAAEAGRALRLGEALLSGTLGALNARALLTVRQMLAELEAPADRAEHDQLLATFRAALQRHEDLVPQAAAAATPAERSARAQRALQEQIDEARRSSAVRHAMEQLAGGASPPLERSGDSPPVERGGVPSRTGEVTAVWPMGDGRLAERRGRPRPGRSS